MYEVLRSPEYERVAALPRRALTPEYADQYIAPLNAVFAERETSCLKRWQALAIVEAVQHQGAWLALPVGQGKTLLSYLLPTALESRRTLLVVPASLKEKTLSDFASYRGHWRTPTALIRVETREMLATVQGATILQEYAPDLIVIDEADDLSRARASTPTRIDRYVRANPGVRVVAMTGTPSRKSILGYWHMVCWCLGDRAPLPLVQEEARMWALALDEYAGDHARPGPLGATLKEARAWYRQRLVDTPGVVVVDEDSCDAPLSVRLRLASECPILSEAYERFLTLQENPAGMPVSDPLSLWLLDGQLGLGLYSRWNPPPPEAWRGARRAFAKFVREAIARPRNRPLDTEAQVARAFPEHPIVARWRELKDTFTEPTETVWLSDRTLRDCQDWLDESPEQSIVWCGNVEFGKALAMRTGLPYFGPKGETADGKALHEHERGSFIASWNANKKGFNLQAWRRVLVTMPPASAKWLEQIIGRSHRQGQERKVQVDILATSGGTFDVLRSALDEAKGVRAREGLTQKILRADMTWDRIPEGAHPYRWAMRKGRKD